jgi:hypothetical protein
MRRSADPSVSLPAVLARSRARVLVIIVALSLGAASTLHASTVTATWNPNPEADVVGYRLLYGTVSGTYTTTIDVGNVTTTVVTVPGGQTYYFAVQAYNSSGLSSPNSAEVALLVAASSAPTLTSLSPTSGVVGTAVTVTGTNFGATKGTSTVTFNGVVATPTNWTPTMVIVPVPAGATSGNVVVTVSGAASNALPYTVTPVATSPIAFVQQAYATPASGTTVTVPLPTVQTAGNLNVVAVGWDDVVRTVGSVTDTRGNVYTRAIGPTVLRGAATQSIYYAKNIAAGANSLTVTFSGVAAYPDVRVAEYSGLDRVTPVDIVAGASGQSALADSGAALTTTATDLLVAANYTLGVTSGPGAGYTARVITDPDADLLEDQVVSAPGSYHATSPFAGVTGWIIQLVAFRAPPVAGQAASNLTAGVSSTSLAATGMPVRTASVTARSKTDMMRSTDYDGDGKSDVIVYHSDKGAWEILQSHAGFATRVRVAAGANGDVSVAGDYDGDGKTDLGLFHPATGQWEIPLSGTNYTTSLVRTWGGANDVPVAGDFDGDGKTDLAVFHPATGQWDILLSSTNYTTSLSLALGTATDIPVTADYDGDGKTDIGIYHPATGQWRVLLSSTNFMTGFDINWGAAGDIPVPGDYDGDGQTDLAVYHPATGQWDVLLSSTAYATRLTLAWGTAAGIPAQGDYDGDGKADAAIFNPATGQWQILFSGAGYTTSMTTIKQ